MTSEASPAPMTTVRVKVVTRNGARVQRAALSSIAGGDVKWYSPSAEQATSHKMKHENLGSGDGTRNDTFIPEKWGLAVTKPCACTFLASL